MSRDLHKTVEYDHPPERVWRALTTSEILARWLMPNDFEPRLGHRFEFRADPGPGFDGVVACEVLEFEPPHHMVWGWRGGPIDTTVHFRLEPRPDGGTTLHFEQRGFRGPLGLIVRKILGAGFHKMYHQRLPAELDRLAAEDAPSAS